MKFVINCQEQTARMRGAEKHVIKFRHTLGGNVVALCSPMRFV